jgi:hypothetical protein
MSSSSTESLTPSPVPLPPTTSRAPIGSAAGTPPAENDDSLPAVAYRARRGLEIARDNRRELAALREQLGREPDPKLEEDEGEGVLGRVSVVESTIGHEAGLVRGRKREASGLIAITASLGASVDGLKSAVVELKGSLDKFEKERADRKDTAKRVAWSVLIPLAVTGLGGIGTLLWRFLSTLHH